jgi:hypothetical protein
VQPGRSSARELAAAALASGTLLKEVAVQADVSERTLRRWRSEPAFKALVTELRGEMIGQAAGRLADGMSAAADVLTALLKDEDSNVRLKASAKLLEMALKVRDQAELEERLARVESLLVGGADRGDHAGEAEATGDDGEASDDPPDDGSGEVPP